MSEPVSDALRELLRRQGMSTGPVGAGRVHGRKARGAAGKGARSQLRQRELLPMGIRLVSSNTCEPTRTKAGKPLPGVGSHLVLVWSDGHLVTAGRSRTMR